MPLFPPLLLLPSEMAHILSMEYVSSTNKPPFTSLWLALKFSPTWNWEHSWQSSCRLTWLMWPSSHTPVSCNTNTGMRDSAASPCCQSEKPSTYSAIDVCMSAKSLQWCLTSVTQWTVAYQTPLSIGVPRQEYWNGEHCPPPGDISEPGIKPMSPASPPLQADYLSLSHWGSPSAI